MAKSQSRQTDADPAIADHLGKLREKLLDLTARNRLISFTHSVVGCLRVVDELPNQLFARLIDEATLYFSPIPEPSERELREFHTDGSRVPRVESDSAKLAKPKAEVWAKFKGFSTDYELPVEVDDTEREKKHDDAFIQTLLYPADLETRLRKLRGDARTAIEESGVNMLHLAFGFLEWRDDRSTQDKGYLAPLLLLPVELKKTVRTRSVDYALSWTGEELQQNLSLAKKLDRDFGLALPDIDEDETPESYFDKVRNAVRNKPRWRIRRNITLSLFNFGKLLLYLDLDPARWPSNGKITNQPLVQSILGATSEEGSQAEHTNEPVDALYIDTELNLVDRADSSQAEGLAYALSGKSLVIQGPPGTGKSQTITNLIAAALAEGKTVLFVSEKLAALEVVRRRLRELGLGDFCLELHSNKTRKLNLIKDLENRLSLANKLPPAHKLKAAKEEQLNNRNGIERYVELLQRPIGKIERKLSQVLFEAGSARLDLGDAATAIFPPSSFDPAKIGAIELGVADRYFEEFGDAVLAAGGIQSLKEHPWQGIAAAKVLAPDAHHVAGLARAWASAATSLKKEIDAFSSFIQRELSPSVTTARGFEGLTDRLVKAKQFFKNAKSAEWFCEQVEGYLDTSLPKHSGRYHVSIKLVEAARAFPADFGHLRGPWLYDDQFEAAVSRVEDLCESARDNRRMASGTLDMSRPHRHSSDNLRAAAELLRSKSILRSLSPRWRGARAVWDAYAKPGQKITPAALEALARLLDDLSILNSDEKAKTLFGKAFQGQHTSVRGLRGLRSWKERVERDLSGVRLADKIVMLDGETIAALASGADHDAFSSVRSCAELTANKRGNETDGDDPWVGYVSGSFVGPVADFLKSSLEESSWVGLMERAASVESVSRKHQEALQQFVERVGLDYATWFNSRPSELLADIANRATFAAERVNQLKDWLKIQGTLESAPDQACMDMALEGLRGAYPLRLLSTVYRHFLYDGLARKCFERYPELRALRGRTLDSLRDSFRGSDEALMEIRRTDIAHRLVSRRVPEGRFSQRVSELTEMHLIKNEVSKQKRHIPIRRLVERAGRALQALKPCFMMGPMSVAQYLQPGSLSFDFIIMDEASQLRPEDAVGALGRAKQAVIVGDPKQLPPTSFFDTQLGSVDDEQSDEGAYISQMSESILDLAQVTFAKRMLQWHYRSRHPSLIQFSNREFYNGELVVFPSPVEENDRYGVSHEYVNGLFSDHVNLEEARRVAAAAVTHLKEHPSRSLGVVAMNINQKELIEAEIDTLSRGDPLLLRTTEDTENRTEPFFVKNLENVQGDERDAIIISMTYGPEELGGRVLQRFGPINQDVGWRRLNVLFTRAKEKMHVVSSMRAEDILLGDNPSRGIQALKAFLQFAERGRESRTRESSRNPDSDFELAVQEGLQSLGYNCVPQLGVAGFFIDLAVRDPDQPEEFIAGIECDGATYHSTRSARDRDRLRQDILEDLGWEIERVWSVDWFQDPSGELARVAKRLNDLTSARRATRDRKSVVADLLQTRDLSAEGPERSNGALAEKRHREQSTPPNRQSSFELNTPDTRLTDTTLSAQDARDLLIELRESEIKPKYVDSDPSKGFLRKSMLDSLLKHKPTSIEEFQSKLPRSLRAETDGRQLKEFGERVFEILERVE